MNEHDSHHSDRCTLRGMKAGAPCNVIFVHRSGQLDLYPHGQEGMRVTLPPDEVDTLKTWLLAA